MQESVNLRNLVTRWRARSRERDLRSHNLGGIARVSFRYCLIFGFFSYTMKYLSVIDEKIRETFALTPYNFFTEHDIHSEISHIASNFLIENDELSIKTRDGKKVGRIHHEYPTPFRCYMKGSEFRLVTEEEFEDLRKKKRDNDMRINVRRGHFDVVIFSKNYLENNIFLTITGKDYDQLKDTFKETKESVLDLAIEVVYFLGLHEDKPHLGIMDRFIKSIIQDYKKLQELMAFKVNGEPFCKEAVMMVFANTPYKNKVMEKIRNIEKADQVKLFIYINEA